MARTKLKTTVIASAGILLGVCIVILAMMLANGFFSRDEPKLPVGGVTPVISLGETHGLILAFDGSLWSWGNDFVGWPVLGLGNVHSQTRLCRIGHDTNWVGVSAACEHNLALKSDGTIWAWGENTRAELGDGTGALMQNRPVPSIPGTDWKQVAAGSYSSLALKKDGTLWAWGMNWAGELGVGFTNRSVTNAMQVGTATNWIKVWAGGLETVAMQSDGSLWYWGENPNPAFAQGAGQIVAPMRISPDSNWTDVGIGTEGTVFAIKSDGTLWAWGRQAHVYTGVTNRNLDAAPTRVGTDSDWRSISTCGLWWCQGLTRKDGSRWLMDASDGKPNGPRSPYKPVRFRRLEFQKDCVAFIAGAAHAAAPGVHAPIGVALTREGEVWTWGLVLGEPPQSPFQALAQNIADHFHFNVQLGFRQPSIRSMPWQLSHLQPKEPAAPSSSSPRNDQKSGTNR